MSGTLLIIISSLAVLCIVVLCLSWISVRNKKFFIPSSGILVLIAIFCGYGFLAAGEYDGSKELMWKAGYAIAGVALLVGASLFAVKSKVK